MDYSPSTDNRFASVILVLGVLSILSVFTGILPSVLGGLGVTFSVIGHRKGAVRTPSETLGLITSAVGLGIGLMLLAFAVLTIVTYYTDPAAFSQMEELYRSYGIDLRSMLEGSYMVP